MVNLWSTPDPQQYKLKPHKIPAWRAMVKSPKSSGETIDKWHLLWQQVSISFKGVISRILVILQGKEHLNNTDWTWWVEKQRTESWVGREVLFDKIFPGEM